MVKIFRMFFLAIVLLVNVEGIRIDSSKVFNSWNCHLPNFLKREINGYQNFVNEVILQTTQDHYSGRYYNDLREFIDKFDNRLAGTKNLEDAIDYIANKSIVDGLKVQLEPVKVPNWIRGYETAYLVSPRRKELKITGLGYSPGTGPQGLTADVVVISDFIDLEEKAKEVKGKIVLFNSEFTSYEATVTYRSRGPSRAGKLGAVAALVRSVTPFSIYSPHTGTTHFDSEEKKIPAAAVTLEDADTMARMFRKGLKVTIRLIMNAKLQGEKISRNLLADIPGAELPDHYVTVSGHIDSWDVGQGALDDGVGAFLALHSLLLLKFMNVPRPKRTVRAILWTGEEEGLIGAVEYSNKHKSELQNWTAAMESDSGSYTPLGLNLDGSEEAFCILKEIASLFKDLNSTEVIQTTGVGSDISIFKPYGVPLIDPHFGSTNYMWFHHLDGDSMRTLNSTIMDKNLALFAGTSYILANLSVQLPRAEQSVWSTRKFT